MARAPPLPLHAPSCRHPSFPLAARPAASHTRISTQQVELLKAQLREAATARATAEAALASLRKETAAYAHRKHQVGAWFG